MKIALFFTIIGYVCFLVYNLVNRNLRKVFLSPTRESTTILRGGMALIIVWVHFSIFSPTPVPFSGYFAALGAPIVAMFLFLSGYGLMKSWEIHGESFWNGYLGRRFSKLLWPLAVATFVFQIVQWRGGVFSISQVLNGFKQGDPPLPFSWFVYEIAALYLIFYICGRWIRNRTLFIFLLSLCILITYALLRQSGWLYVWYCTLPCFIIGVLWCMQESRFIALLNKYPAIVMTQLIAYCILQLSLLMYSDGYENPCELYGQITLFSLPVIWYVMLIVIGQIHGRLANALGRISYEIYVFHGIFIMSMSQIVGGLTSRLFFVFVGTLLSASLMYTVQYKKYPIIDKSHLL